MVKPRRTSRDTVSAGGAVAQTFGPATPAADKVRILAEIDRAGPGGVGATLREIVEMLHELSGVPIEVHFKPAYAVDAPSVVLDISRAESQLGWRPTVSLREGSSAILAAETRAK